MKKTIILSIFIALVAVSLEAQNDTMYIMKDGVIVGRYNVNNQIDSLVYDNPFAFTDARDGNTYGKITIGNQTWMAENLKYLPSVQKKDSISLTSPRYYVYNYNDTIVANAKATTNYSTYGVLYNWPAAMNGAFTSSTNPSGVQGICPDGWHLPSDAEFEELISYLGGSSVAGGKLKATILWQYPNADATNESGFSALPAGCLYGPNKTFLYKGMQTYWWTTKEDTYITDAWLCFVSYHNTIMLVAPDNKTRNCSVRCLKN